MSELYELPNGWEWTTLGDKKVCSLIMGQSPSSDTYNSSGMGMPFFQGKKEFGELYPTVEQYCTEPNKIAKIGDILLSVRAPVGPTNLANIECCIGRGLASIRPNYNNTNTNYLLYFFRNFEIEISKKGKGSTFSAITKKELEDTSIPLPPLSEQQRIVKKLDLLFEKIDKAISLHQKNIDEAEAFMGSVLNEVFEGLNSITIEKLKDCYIVKDGTHNSPKYIENGFPLFTSKNLKENGLDTTNFNCISQLDYDEINKRSKVDKGDLLFAMIGTIGNPTIVNFEPNFAIKNVALFKPLDNSYAKIEYLRYYLLSPFVKDKMKTEANGATQKFVGLTYLREFNIPLPTLNIQQKVVQYLDETSEKIERVKTVQKEKMDSLKALKASILDKAFRGEI